MQQKNNKNIFVNWKMLIEKVNSAYDIMSLHLVFSLKEEAYEKQPHNKH